MRNKYIHLSKGFRIVFGCNKHYTSKKMKKIIKTVSFEVITDIKDLNL